MQLTHGHPVEDILVFPTGGLLLSAGSNIIKIWDTLSGRCVQSISNHQKAITALCLDSQGKRLLSASLDHHVKVSA